MAGFEPRLHNMMSSLNTFKGFAPGAQRAALYALVCMAALALSACQRYENLPQCSEVIAPGDTGYFTVSDDGMATDSVTSMRWYRCNAGERYKDGQCVGTAVELVRAEALAYAEEFSQASGRKWRLPTQSEMQTLRLSQCVNPSINANVFPSVKVSNYWTSTESDRNSALGCTTYTYNGNDFCGERKDVARPFLLVVN
jgi:hypothetical protein